MISDETIAIVSGIASLLMLGLLIFLIAYKYYQNGQKKVMKIQSEQKTTKFDTETTEQNLEEK